jgi:hypothetical protein
LSDFVGLGQLKVLYGLLGEKRIKIDSPYHAGAFLGEMVSLWQMWGIPRGRMVILTQTL